MANCKIEGSSSLTYVPYFDYLKDKIHLSDIKVHHSISDLVQMTQIKKNHMNIPQTPTRHKSVRMSFRMPDDEEQKGPAEEFDQVLISEQSSILSEH
jgi:hypothetical protein